MKFPFLCLSVHNGGIRIKYVCMDMYVEWMNSEIENHYCYIIVK